MRNKVPPSTKVSADYVVGQVSGSLFPRNCAASSSLSTLFSTKTPVAPLLFQPPPKPVEKSSDTEEQHKGRPGAKGKAALKKNKSPKRRSTAELKLENRESSFQDADEDERGPSTVRKRKLLEWDGEKHAEYWVLKRQRLKASRGDEQIKRKRTVFVGNLPISCTKKSLRSIFRDTGFIESIRFRSLVREDPSMTRKVATITRKVHPKKQSLNAYVVFKDEDGAAKALERNGMEVERDFHIRVDRVTDLSSHDHRRSVFVGNLSFEIKEAPFRRHFEECGTVEAVRLVRDKNSGMGKGFGYVLFQSIDSVQLALELNGSKLEGRSIRVKRSETKEKQKKITNRKGTARRFGQGPVKALGLKIRAGEGGFKSPKGSGSFKGEMVEPSKKTKKGLKKKVKQNNSGHRLVCQK